MKILFVIAVLANFTVWFWESNKPPSLDQQKKRETGNVPSIVLVSEAEFAEQVAVNAKLRNYPCLLNESFTDWLKNAWIYSADNNQSAPQASEADDTVPPEIWVRCQAFLQ